jgi:hypothetical protein
VGGRIEEVDSLLLQRVDLSLTGWFVLVGESDRAFGRFSLVNDYSRRA